MTFLSAKCPSCGGLNTSCPDGCGRDSETGELNGTRLSSTEATIELMMEALEQAVLALETLAIRNDGLAPIIEQGNAALAAAPSSSSETTHQEQGQ